MTHPTRRQILATGAAVGASLWLPRIAHAQVAPANQIRIGVITPSSSGRLPIFTPGEDIIGDAGRRGALMADGVIGELAAAAGKQFVFMPANAPTASAALRAVQRFIETDSVDAIIGGVGVGQAGVIAPAAEAAGVPFFNIGTPSEALRRECYRYTFHMEASEAMYIDALIMLGASQGYRRWFIVHENTADGEVLRQRGVEAIARYGDGGEVVGASAAAPESPYYGPQLTAADAAGAEAVLLLIGDVDQLVFTAQEDSLSLPIPVFPLPYPNTQTREYLQELRIIAPTTSPASRIALWDATLEANGAGEFNNRYITQWGDPIEAPAWSSYFAVKILLDAVIATGTKDGATLVDYLENSGTEYDVAKGPGVSFRPWDHQLRQPLYVVNVNFDAEWAWDVPTTHVALVSAAGELPLQQGGDAIARLDMLGDGPDTAACR
jgi:ABC-type branched-subunit amino acid transport system substrate-binding protein